MQTKLKFEFLTDFNTSINKYINLYLRQHKCIKMPKTKGKQEKTFIVLTIDAKKFRKNKIFNMFMLL